ncbi:MAG TPA: hypothetical protein PKB15_02325 [Acidimicrobiia bacterium]|nr:hypothetical protein [Acidimicrobiia bacterium]
MSGVKNAFNRYIHDIDLVQGLVPNEVRANPALVHEVQLDPRDRAPEGHQAYRYIVALHGDGRTAARHRLHDRFLDYKSGPENSFFAFYRTKEATAALVLDIPPLEMPGRTQGKPAYKQENWQKIKEFVGYLEDCNVVIVRGTFKSPEEFIAALDKAFDHDHTKDNIPKMSIVKPSDGAHAASVVLGDVSQVARRVLGNVPGGLGVSGAMKRASLLLEGWAGITPPGNNEPPQR